MAKQGFAGQWIPIAKVGKFVSDDGVDRDLSAEFLASVVANYAADEHEAPAVVGHPAADVPAYGWVSELRLNDGQLEARFADTDDEFEKLVEQGRFKKRSAAFWLESPRGSAIKSPGLKHVGFLGAARPSVKGLKNIQFEEGGESFTLETSINFQEKEMTEENLDQMPESFWTRLKAGLGLGTSAEAGGTPAAPIQFSEGDVRSLIDRAVTELTASFTQQLDEKDAALKDLAKRVDAGDVSSRRGEIAQFVESIPAGKGKHFLKRIGIAEFCESLAAADDADRTPAINFSEGTGDSRVEHKFSRLDWFKNYVNALPAYIQFGEQFGDLKATQEASLEMVNAEELTGLRKGMGVEEKQSGGEK